MGSSIESPAATRWRLWWRPRGAPSPTGDRGDWRHEDFDYLTELELALFDRLPEVSDIAIVYVGSAGSPSESEPPPREVRAVRGGRVVDP